MEFFFQPKGVAVVGASANPVKGGHFILSNLVRGYRGAVFPVNPAYEEILDLKCYPSVLEVPDPVDLAIIFVPAAAVHLKCYPSVLEVPDPVDLAIIFVPAAAVPAVLRACAQRGIKGVMIESGGFAESGDQGRQLQQSIIEIHHETGIRIWGPNCMGLVDAVLFHTFVSGDEPGANVTHLVEMARKAGKPLFGWVMGSRDDAHQFQQHARELGLPVFGELHRAVECMAAVLLR